METTSRTAVVGGLVLAVALGAGGCGGHPAARSGDRPDASAATAAGGRADAHLVVETDNGVRLRPRSADDRVTVADRGVRARFTSSGTELVLDLTCAPAGGDCPRMPTVEVPAGTDVSVVARNAGVDVAGLTGALRLTTVNGDITVAGAGGTRASVALSTRNGSVRASGLRAATLAASTVNGDVLLACRSAPAAVDADTTNGSVRFSVPPGPSPYRVTATTDNGRTHVTLPTSDAATGPHAVLRTVNGDVTASTGT